MEPDRPVALNKRRAGRLWLTIGLLAICGMILLALLVAWLTPAGRNELAIGPQASVGALEIALQPPLELDHLSSAEILHLREEAIVRYPALLGGRYAPSRQVFQMADGLPWWGIAGQFYNGKGEHSVDGPAEESRFLLNPYLLVGAEFSGLSIWSGGARALAWDKARITTQDLADPDFPFYCPPTSLRWWPHEARAEATYDVSACLAAMNDWTLYPLGVADASFDLVAYNARDLGLGYLYWSPLDSQNLSVSQAMRAPIAISQFIHRGSSCGFPGGCNNMSPRVPELCGIQIKRLPARAVIRLWQGRPASAEQGSDMTVVLVFR